MNQNNVFYKSEGDQWFKRNEAVLLFRNQNYDWPIKLIRKHKIKPQKVLEIGAANGWRLAEIKKLYGRTRCVGVEPSAKAVWAGRRNFPQIKMLRGLSSDLPVKGTFDLVIVNYVLHWVDRALLFKTFSEIDRVLADDGYLIVSDFYPSVATSNLYHHIRGGKVRTYKQNYAEMFLPGGWPSYYKQAKGIEVVDLDGNRYLDFSTMGVGSCILGYADKDVNRAVKLAIDKGSMSTLNCPEEVELAELLCSLHPWAHMVRFARTGGEAMAVAVRIARAHTGKDKIAFCVYRSE